MDFNATILGQTISFIIFVTFCMKFIWPPIINIIDKRQKELKKSLKLQKKIKEDLERSKNVIKQEINNAKLIAQEIISEANSNKYDILSKVELEATKKKDIIISQAYIEIENHRQKVYKELQQDISNIAILIAKKIITNSLQKNRDSDLINNLIIK